MARRITEAEVNQLYEKYHTPPHVIAHCRAVTRVATGLAEVLNQHGYHFDIELIRGAGLAHDTARTQEDHGKVCADILQSLGFSDEAAIVRVHMNFQLDPVDRLTETDMVCIGDRLVKEDRYVGVDERFRYIIEKAPRTPEVRRHLEEQREIMRHLLEQIEKIIGTTIDILFENEN
ncbi:MAG: HD domain-containing protein [Firmicutes bacterium]|nr:HD domain-containing protein [Bacillota bacterium]MDD7601998.1 HD domain-containing protein [Bacillota bacterium]MDY5856014.1 HD domain-containing protein [Anaerovoracaceae bacterium]